MWMIKAMIQCFSYINFVNMYLSIKWMCIKFLILVLTLFDVVYYDLYNSTSTSNYCICRNLLKNNVMTKYASYGKIPYNQRKRNNQTKTSLKFVFSEISGILIL